MKIHFSITIETDGEQVVIAQHDRQVDAVVERAEDVGVPMGFIPNVEE